MAFLKTFRLWELALALGIIAAIIFGAWAQREQDKLSEKLIRLHVVANSDSEFDQQVKLKVRDRILTAAQPLLNGISSADEAERIITENLPYLEQQARLELDSNGSAEPVTAALARESFPTREYRDFELPAGEYQALRVTIGDGTGKNWWCVVFPPLCGDSAGIAESAKTVGLSDGDVSLISDSDGVKIKFKCIEIWQKLKNMI